MLYFAYGSNMCVTRLAARVSEVQVMGAARLPDHQLHCDKRGGDGSAKFTIAAQPGAAVHGVLFRLQHSAREILNGFEGPGYAARQVSLLTAGGECRALTYQATGDWRDAGLLPFDWYLAFAIAGATEHGLPAACIQRLQAWPCQADPVAERAALNRAILDGEQPDLTRQRQWPC